MIDSFCFLAYKFDNSGINKVFRASKIKSQTNLDHTELSKIGNQAQAEAIIKGSYTGTQDSLTVNVQLYNVKSGNYQNQKGIKLQ